MAKGFKSGGRQKGTPNRRTQVILKAAGAVGITREQARSYSFESWATRSSGFRALDRMISMAKWFETQAAKEQAKESPDQEKIERLLFKAHAMCAKIAEYQDPKLTSVRVAGADGGAVKHEHTHAGAYEHITSAIARLAARSAEDGDPTKLN